MRLLLALALVLLASPVWAQGTELTWEQYFDAAHQAFENGNYWEARHMFQETSKEAARCQQDVQFAKRLENLAEQYASIKRFKVAEVLYKQAIKIYEYKLGPTHVSLAQVIRKYAGILRTTRREEQARDMEMRAVAILSGHGT